MTDQELVNQIREAVDALNNLLEDARANKIEFEIRTSDITRFGDRGSVRLLTVEDFRKVQYL